MLKKCKQWSRPSSDSKSVNDRYVLNLCEIITKAFHPLKEYVPFISDPLYRIFLLYSSTMVITGKIVLEYIRAVKWTLYRVFKKLFQFKGFEWNPKSSYEQMEMLYIASQLTYLAVAANFGSIFTVLICFAAMILFIRQFR